ncbi:acetyl-CoA carboxylase biotin carboxyl carrier protein [Meridianimarinicoccus roseus]|uniref:Biotin carboxyl carrier protein of acetyl-CoA carboxylase n=1 Tax=Meridianimarinicoccus roseus TaxID=2072018 RepID=A0A2V2LP46_9RHOB|nr:acetyl-CoA carboxylase biotin carboxyl carrier protein [Meridianimarinicoccus roseus]PWR03443.1 acetyl-CoA carboxylase biotin carboxyl carrier protein [Meridianimarinicoccus roseus]
MTQTSHGDDVAFIRALAELLRDNDLTELEVKRDYGEDSKLNVRVTRTPPAVVQAPAVSAPVPAVAPAAAPQAASASGGGDAAPAAEDPSSHPGVVPSPMVGTVYLQPEPGTDPFVRVGSKVSKGQTILIVEAMKTMNQIAAPHDGTVTRVLVEDGSPVEYGAPLVIIE